jgi:hypothetical protein
MLTDAEARRISCEWHGGGGSALYALCSTGAIVGIPGEGVYDGATIYPAAQEIMVEHLACIARDDVLARAEARDLRSLSDYVYAHGPRGPVDGWSKLPWEE